MSPFPFITLSFSDDDEDPEGMYVHIEFGGGLEQPDLLPLVETALQALKEEAERDRN